MSLTISSRKERALRGSASTAMTLAQHIERDLRERILTGRTPVSLTLDALAHEYEVSHMPVREALAALVEEKLLVRARKGGPLEIDRARAAKLAQAPPTEDREASIDWSGELGEEVVRLSLHGYDGYLRENATASRFGISRATVRSVFLRLSGRGMLEHVPRCGWLVRPFREEDATGYLEIRELLERKALQLAVPHLERDELERYLEENRPDPDGNPRLDDSLHGYWIARSRNRYIQDFFEHHGPYFWAIFQYAAVAQSDELAKAVEHRAILEALLASDLGSADEALTEHIRGQRGTLARAIEGLDRAAGSLEA